MEETDDILKLNIKIRRLKRKIEKVSRQRDFYKKERDGYAHVLCMQPQLKTNYLAWEERRELNVRIKEQSKLIELLRIQNANKKL